MQMFIGVAVLDVEAEDDRALFAVLVAVVARSMARVGISASMTRRTVFAKASVVLRREKSMTSWFIVRIVT